jgi:hypothetical protein
MPLVLILLVGLLASPICAAQLGRRRQPEEGTITGHSELIVTAREQREGHSGQQQHVRDDDLFSAVLAQHAGEQQQSDSEEPPSPEHRQRSLESLLHWAIGEYAGIVDMSCSFWQTSFCRLQAHPYPPAPLTRPLCDLPARNRLNLSIPACSH